MVYVRGCFYVSYDVSLAIAIADRLKSEYYKTKGELCLMGRSGGE